MHAQPATKPRVLLVDDEPQVLVALGDLLGEDYEVFKTTSPQAALELLVHDRDIAVIIADQQMPRMTGEELLAALPPESEAQRIIVTGFADVQALIRTINSGQLFAYVQKPWNPNDLREKVDRAAHQFQLCRTRTTERELLHQLLDHGPDGIGMTRDVADRLQAQRALAESESVLQKQTSLFNAILEGLAEGVVVTDHHGNFLLCNRESERMLSLDANALDVSNWIRLCGLYEADNRTPLAPEDDPLARAIAGVERTERELCLRSEGVLRLRVGLIATPLRGIHGEVIGGICLLRDLTEHREMEDRLSQAQKMDALGRLAGGVAHDFNNLLSVIQSCGELLLRSLSSNDPKRIELGHILNASQRAALLTRQLLSFSRQSVVQPKTLLLNDVVRAIAPMLRRVISEHIEVIARLGDDAGLVTIDAGQLEQVILNLALNARDAMPNGGVLRIETSNRVNPEGGEPRLPAGDFVVLTIRDTGTGMGVETQSKMFEPFFTTKDLGKGSGLGLSTVYGILEQNAGHIRCETAPERGTAFEIYLNRVYATQTQSAPPITRDELRAEGNGTILLVEDEDSVRRVAAAILRNHGYTVLEARRPSDAIQICSRTQQPIDLLLTDVVMPESSGPQLAAELTSRQPNMGVMYMSGYSGDNALMGKALRDGITFLQKPFTPALLTEAVSEALTRPHAALRAS